MDNEEKDVGRELAQWLKEAGTRVGPPRPALSEIFTAQAVSARASWDRQFAAIKRMSLLSLLTASYLMYYYADVMLQISLLQSLIVFVPTTGAA